MPKEAPVYRNHTALKFAAGLSRLFAVLVAIGTVIGALNIVVSYRSAFVPLTATQATTFAIGILIFGLVYAALFWAAADAFIMLADSDDAHRLTHFRLTELSAQVEAFRAANQGQFGRLHQAGSAPATPPASP